MMREGHSLYYDRKGNPIPREEAWPLFEGTERIVKQTREGDIFVSTVHLVIDHSWGDGPPIIFETMIFGGWKDQAQWRYATETEARLGHRRACVIAFAPWWRRWFPWFRLEGRDE